MSLQQLLVGAFFVAFAVVGLTDHQPSAFALIPDPLDAGGYPTIAATLLLISLALTFVEDLRLKARGKVPAIAPMSKDVAVMIALLILYVIAFEHLGFYLSTLAFCFVSLLLSFKGEKPDYKAICAYTLGTLLFWVAILKGFNLYLPSGLLL
jgi:asparagine N-glycosylation enzyme membrane subunit Stt3